MIGAVTGVLLTLRSGLLAVPAVTGRSGIEATAILENAGLVAVDGGQRFSVTVPNADIAVEVTNPWVSGTWGQPVSAMAGRVQRSTSAMADRNRIFLIIIHPFRKTLN